MLHTPKALSASAPEASEHDAENVELTPDDPREIVVAASKITVHEDR